MCLGDAVDSFIDCAGRLIELPYNYSEFVFDLEWPNTRALSLVTEYLTTLHFHLPSPSFLSRARKDSDCQHCNEICFVVKTCYY